MTLKLRDILLTAIFAVFVAWPTIASAQLPFDNVPEPDNSGDQDRPLRPVDAASGAFGARPQDDEIETREPVQPVSVKQQFAGWQEAGDVEGDRLSDSLRANWVMLDRNGQFSGTVRGIEGAEVPGMTVFLMNRGRLVKTAAVQEDGSFTFTNVQRGSYSFVGWGDKAFFCFGANILNYNPDADSSTPTSVDVLAFQNETTINTDWIRYFTPNTSFRVYGAYESGEGVDDPDHLYGFEGLTEHAVRATASTSVGAVPVSLDSRGRMVGRVHQMNAISGRPVDVRTTKVMLLKGDDVVGSTSTDNFGIFQFADVPLGTYGLVAVSVDGVGSVGIEVVEESESAIQIDADGLRDVTDASARPFDFCMVTSETVGWLNHYADEVAYRRAILAPRRPADPRQQLTDPVCPTCNGIMGHNGCAHCGRNGANPNCRNPNISFGQWQASGCGSVNSRPLAVRLGEKIRDGVEGLDARFERAFYGDSLGGQGFGTPNGGVGNGVGGGGAANQGFAPQGGQSPQAAPAGSNQFLNPPPAAGGSQSRNSLPGARPVTRRIGSTPPIVRRR